jgi:hypothetical protein
MLASPTTISARLAVCTSLTIIWCGWRQEGKRRRTAAVQPLPLRAVRVSAKAAPSCWVPRKFMVVPPRAVPCPETYGHDRIVGLHPAPAADCARIVKSAVDNCTNSQALVSI